MDYRAPENEEKRSKHIQAILNYFGPKFFNGKKVLELGCGYADIASKFADLGSIVMAVDVRESHLAIADRLHPNVYYIPPCDLNGKWPFHKKECFDLTIHTGLLNYLDDYEKSIRDACSTTKFLVLEAEVLDSDDNSLVKKEPDHPDDFGSLDGNIGRPSVAAIERVLKRCKMKYFPVMTADLNTAKFKYNWRMENDGSPRVRFWIAEKK